MILVLYVGCFKAYFVFEFKIRMLEKLRLSAWKKNPVNAEKDKETKDGPKILENNVSSVTKGVKFAVSMFILFVIDYIMYLSLDQNSDPNFFKLD